MSPHDNTFPSTADELARLPASSEAAIETALAELVAQRDEWVRVDARQRRRLVERLISSFAKVAPRWVEACLEAEGIPPAHPMAAEEWLAGPYLVLRNLQLLKSSLGDITQGRRPRIPGPVSTRANGQVVAQVFPTSTYDRLFYPRLTAETWMEPGITTENLAESQAVTYFASKRQGGVALVLGAGNVSSIGPMDTLYKLFVEDRVVLFKAHPVNDYLGPLLEEGFAPLVERGVLRVVYGGAALGARLTTHPAIDEIHITGSDKTVEAIVFGTGEEGRKAKAERRPRNQKAISSELGNVSPVLVVPGPWRDADFAYHAENLAAMLANNAGFNCNATRVIVTASGWSGRERLLAALRAKLAQLPTRRAFYPGAASRWQTFRQAHSQAETFGPDGFGRLPWLLIPEVPADSIDEICFTTEAFAPVFAEVKLEAAEAADFLQKAVAFANERLWGTLNACLLVHPATRRRWPKAVEQAVADLRYGTVSINHWPAVGYGLVVTPWGAYPGSDLYDIQSGSGWVHNTLMFDRPQKAVIRAPFRAFPKPPWFPSHTTAHRLAEVLTRFEAERSPLLLPKIFALATTG